MFKSKIEPIVNILATGNCGKTHHWPLCALIYVHFPHLQIDLVTYRAINKLKLETQEKCLTEPSTDVQLLK